MEFNKEFDASGLSCPLPIVKTKKALADMSSGQVLKVISTDPPYYDNIYYADLSDFFYVWLRKSLNCAQRAEDLSQDTFVRLLGRADRLCLQPGR